MFRYRGNSIVKFFISVVTAYYLRVAVRTRLIVRRCLATNVRSDSDTQAFRQHSTTQ
jgi:hypothetical protein